MRTLLVCSCVIFFVIITSILCFPQPYYSQIGTSSLDDATGYGNGFKIVAVPNQFPEMVLYAVYGFSQDSCYFAYSYDRGLTWSAQSFFATTYGNAQYPSLDVYDSLPYIVTQGDSGGQSEIFLKCPLDWGTPQKVSSTPGHSTLPAIVIGDTFNCHIVWQDDTPGNDDIYYCCAHYPSSVTGTVNLSNNSAEDRYPSISIFNGNEIHVVWERYDSSTYSPYSIVHRSFSGGVWSNEDTLVQSTFIPHHHPSLDFCHGEDDISAAWEDSSTGNLDIYFYPGSLVWWPTTGQSRFPVVSMLSTVHSYAYWEDNSDGYDDIYGVVYYNPWRQNYKFRDVYGDEDMHCPNVTNCYVVWTQGNTPPYKVMFACEGYPISVEEEEGEKIITPKITISPNPFHSEARIQISDIRRQKTEDRGPILLTIHDASGRLVKSIRLDTDPCSIGADLKSGIYFLKVGRLASVKMIKLQ